MCCDFRAFCLSYYHAPRRPIIAMRTSQSYCVLRVARAWARRPDHPPVAERAIGTPHFARRDASYGGREDNPPSTNPQCASLNVLSPGGPTSPPRGAYYAVAGPRRSRNWCPIPRADIGRQPSHTASPATRARVTKLHVRRTTLDRGDRPPRQLRRIVLRHAGGELVDLPRRARVV